MPSYVIYSSLMRTTKFITTESGKDLIVSFALRAGDGPAEIESLTLLRTPIYEGFLDESERGVTVSLELDVDHDLLEAHEFHRDSAIVWLRTQSREYKVDVSEVDPDELNSMCQVLALMNFDERLQLSGI